MRPLVSQNTNSTLRLNVGPSRVSKKIDLNVGTYHGAESHIAVSKGSESPNPKSDPLETAIWDAAPWSVPRGPSVEIYYGRPSIVSCGARLRGATGRKGRVHSFLEAWFWAARLPRIERSDRPEKSKTCLSYGTSACDWCKKKSNPS